jgi:hypothetical protein
MSVDALAEKLEVADRRGKLPDVVVPVDFAGASCDVVAIRALADEYGFRMARDDDYAFTAIAAHSEVLVELDWGAIVVSIRPAETGRSVRLSFIVGALEPLESTRLVVFGHKFGLGFIFGVAVYMLGLVAEVFLITAFYMVLPVGPTTFRHALIGGLAATILWEITRRVIVWYYRTFTFVNLIYGSFASVVVFLLGVEAVALIVLLGAQVIAELEHVNEKIR